MKISPARVAAFDILSRIEKERAYASVLLPQYEERLQANDRALCHRLTLGVLQRRIYLDHAIEALVGKKKIDAEVRISLWLGLFQLWYLDKIPAHSAVNESVELVRRARKSSAAGFVNAILRRAGAQAPVFEFSDDLTKVSVESSHPSWLISRWADQFGFAEATRIAHRNNLQPATAFRLTPLAGEGRQFEGAVPSDLVAGAFLAEQVTQEMLEASAHAEIYFQDEGSQLVGNAVRVPAGGLFLDVCGAPGSKFTQIAARDEASFCVAGDLYSHRTGFLLESTRRQGLRQTGVVQYDAESELPFLEGGFDSVLVDAPCSGTGTIRHNPELRYFLKPEDFELLSSKQLTILRNASKFVRDGGQLVYSTCSIEKIENEVVADEFLALEPSFRKVMPAVPDGLVTELGYARTGEHRERMDGFFIAAFEKRA